METGFKASDYRQMAREKLSGHWGLAVGTTIVAGLMGASVTGSSGGFNFNVNFGGNIDINDEDIQKIIDGASRINIDPEELQSFKEIMAIAGPIILVFLAIGLIFAIATFVLGGPTSLGLCAFNRKLYGGEKAEFNDIVSHFDIFGKAFLTKFLMGIFITLWSLLLIIPGIIASYAYSMTFFIMDEHPEMEVMDAIHASKEMMRGHKWELFCLEFSFIGWWMLAGLTLGIGSIFVMPYTNQAVYAFYKAISAPTIPENIEAPVEIPTQV